MKTIIITHIHFCTLMLILRNRVRLSKDETNIEMTIRLRQRK